MFTFPDTRRSDRAVLEIYFLQSEDDGKARLFPVKRVIIERLDRHTGVPLREHIINEVSSSIWTPTQDRPERGAEVVKLPVHADDSDLGGKAIQRGGLYLLRTSNGDPGVKFEIPESVAARQILRMHVVVPKPEPAAPADREDVAEGREPDLVLSADSQWWKTVAALTGGDGAEDRRRVFYAYSTADGRRRLEGEVEAPFRVGIPPEALGGEFAVLVGGGSHVFPVLYRADVKAAFPRVPAEGDVLFRPSSFRQHVVSFSESPAGTRRDPWLQLFIRRESQVPLFMRRLTASTEGEGRADRDAYGLRCPPGRYWVKVDGYLESGNWEGEVTFPAEGEEPVEVRIGP